MKTQTSPQVWQSKRVTKRDREANEKTPKNAAPKRQKNARGRAFR